jgi:hypothetical protein
LNLPTVVPLSAVKQPVEEAPKRQLPPPLPAVIKEAPKRQLPRGFMMATAGAAAILPVVFAILPVTITPRCEGLSTWQNEPVACWQWSWAALRKQLQPASPAVARDDNWIRPDEGSLRTHHHYTNSDGVETHSPAMRQDGGPPQGPSVPCKDGTSSFSAHPDAPGTCSHHGGRVR